jgi:hypothetical protein
MYNVALILTHVYRVNVLQYRGREGLNGDIKNSANIVISDQWLREHYPILINLKEHYPNDNFKGTTQQII